MKYISFETLKQTVINYLFYQLSCIIIFTLVNLITSNLYIYYCANLSWSGFFTSMINSNSPHCISLRYLMNFSIFSTNSSFYNIGTNITDFIYNSLIPSLK